MSTYRSTEDVPSGSAPGADQPQSSEPAPGASAVSVGSEGGAQYEPFYYVTAGEDDRLHLNEGRLLSSLRGQPDLHLAWTPTEAWTGWLENAARRERSLVEQLFRLQKQIAQAREDEADQESDLHGRLSTP